MMHRDALIVSRLPWPASPWLLGLVVAAYLAGASRPARLQAEPPKIGGVNAVTQALAPLHPKHWSVPEVKMPSMSFPQLDLPGIGSEKRVIRRKSDSMFGGISQSVSRGWKSTKKMFQPPSLWPASKSGNSRQGSDEGFWTSWFPEDPEPRKIETVNDFLRQPQPY